ncbi:synaptonemal complex protein 1 isoform X4 [Pan troglodytes]|uniref:synaptonemal complex protein 1 isoform X4 n=1 Tax=Pan troglodytes TaxID=9598 RepID=UPI0023F37EA3|nr:synaptonemal complex protein 1 isoform X4 [Pan troglodytes]XP_054542025.1 synaptonemal complex protein 1 isoform X4 [Pan troglodytes]XP_054542031.1 synaptonemal complex protein 1 isoform X4 [Pan troglodytes]XP_054542033.1 synaptonemal complex protein 1 isoform X4 [Pan troglodytes]
MEKQKPFALFVPPRLSSSQVSAVKPQTLGGDSTFFKSFNKCTEDDFEFPFAKTNLSKNGENIDSDPALQKVNFLPMLEQNSERLSRVYSKLYKEAEKIKKWKVSTEAELRQKESKLQENRKIIEAQRKAIQELQFGNEKVSLKLEEGIQENKDLIKENNATRHLCNLLKETCARSAEKTKKYEYEREETRQVYMDLNNNIEKMITAFEELRVQAENSRLEMHFKLKEDYEKIQHLEQEYKKEINDKEKQVSLLLIQITEKENKMKDLTFLLEESRDKVNQLEEKTKLQSENLKQSIEKQHHLTKELEDIKVSLQRSVSTQKALEEDLQIATKTICQLTEEKETQMEESNKARAAHSFVVTEFETTVCSLEELLRIEQQRLEKNEDQLKILTMELQKKSSELEEMTKLTNNKEVELEELKKVLGEKETLLYENKQFEKIAEELKGTEQELIGLLQAREKEVHDLEIQLTAITTSEQYYSKEVKDLKTELENEKLKNTELTSHCNKLSLENKELTQETSDMTLELKNQQEDINNNKKQEERMLKQIENLQETETQLRNELEYVREELKQKRDEVKCKLDKSEENCNNLRKQVENKNKYIEELQQENKALKKKGTAESKQLNVYEIKVNKLELELESAKQKFGEITDTYQKEIEDKKISEENLLEEVEKAKVIAGEAVKLQKEIDKRCQHKIAEMVALMEKHKHQYDRNIEERDSELGLYKSKEQEQSSLRASLEIELSNLKAELLSVKKQLEIEREEKKKLKREAKENTATLKEKKDKKTQTSLLETPEIYWKLDSKAVPSQTVSRNFTSVDHGISKDKRDYLWTSAKNTLSTPLPKAYTVKTPTKPKLQQRENLNIPIEESNKKRKMAFEFDINSDSSESTDLLSMVSEEETLKTLYRNNNPPASHLCVKTPKKAPSSLTTPGSTLKFGAIRKMREDRWAVIAKMDRKKKLKEAEKLFV